MTFLRSLFVAAALSSAAGPAFARDVAVRPGELQAAIDKAAAGDALKLAPGSYGDVVIKTRPGSPVRIVGTPGAVVGRVMMRGAENWRFENVDFRGGPPTPRPRDSLVEADPRSAGIAFSNCSFATEEDSSGWSAEDWVGKPYQQALFLRGSGMTVSGSRFYNVRNALAIIADDSLVQGNSFDRFGNDAIEFGGSRLKIIGNTIRGGRHSKAEKLHADAMQGFPAPNDGTYSDILIENNRVEASPDADTIQGISAFDGRWANVVVRRNHVVTSSYHGISWYGVDGIVIEDNEVIQERPGKIRPWIAVVPAKNGRPSSGMVVERNKAPLVKFR